jgi:DNA-binding protein HU-beta
MNKGDLINKVSSEAGLSKAQAGKVLDSVLNTVVKSLKKGDKVTLVGFGTFAVAKRAARTGRNPQTGAAIKIPAKKVVKFKAGKEFAGSV